jgi:hypothetical protein
MPFGMVGFSAIGTIFNARSSDPGKVGNTTRLIANKRHYPMTILFSIRAQLAVALITFH